METLSKEAPLLLDPRRSSERDNVRDVLEATAPDGTCVVIGNFDGVHLGHRALFADTRSLPVILPVVAVTFDPHPREVFGKPHARLIAAADRVAMLREAGADRVVILRFTHEVAAMLPEVFVQKLLIDTLNTRVLVIGHDFVLGQGRTGTAEVLAALGEDHFVVRQIPPLHDSGGRLISSSAIRELLRAGEVHLAALQLGRPYQVSGIVGRGFQRGRKLGYPTANLVPEDPSLLLPSPGVYATDCVLKDGRVFPSVTNIGHNPTFGNTTQTVETHLIDFSEDIYDQPLTVRFHRRIRSEVKFPDLDALKAQIRSDTNAAKAFFAQK